MRSKKHWAAEMLRVSLPQKVTTYGADNDQIARTTDTFHVSGHTLYVDRVIHRRSSLGIITLSLSLGAEHEDEIDGAGLAEHEEARNG